MTKVTIDGETKYNTGYSLVRCTEREAHYKAFPVAQNDCPIWLKMAFHDSRQQADERFDSLILELKKLIESYERK